MFHYLYEHMAQDIHYFNKFNRKKSFQCFYLPILWTTQSCWQRGQRLFCFTHKDMQQLWKEWLHSPQTTEREERTCSSHTQLSNQHLQQGPNYHSQMFITTASFRDKMGHHWFIHWDWIIMVILMIVSSLSSILLLISNHEKSNAYLLTFLYKVTRVLWMYKHIHHVVSRKYVQLSKFFTSPFPVPKYSQCTTDWLSHKSISPNSHLKCGV